MNVTQALLGKVAQECAEVAQRASKAQEFGLAEVQEGQDLNNAERIMQEYADLQGVVEMLQERGLLPLEDEAHQARVEAKKAKVLKFFAYSVSLGQIVITDGETLEEGVLFGESWVCETCGKPWPTKPQARPRRPERGKSEYARRATLTPTVGKYEATAPLLVNLATLRGRNETRPFLARRDRSG